MLHTEHMAQQDEWEREQARVANELPEDAAHAEGWREVALLEAVGGPPRPPAAQP